MLTPEEHYVLSLLADDALGMRLRLFEPHGWAVVTATAQPSGCRAYQVTRDLVARLLTFGLLAHSSASGGCPELTAEGRAVVKAIQEGRA
jgi:hypothetical protein